MAKTETRVTPGLPRPSENGHIVQERFRSVVPGTVLYYPDQSAIDIILLRTGRVYTYQRNPYFSKSEDRYARHSGERVINEIIDGPSMLGEEALNGESTYGNVAQALTACEVAYVSREELRRLPPEKQQLILDDIMRRVQKKEQRGFDKRLGKKRTIGWTAGALLDLKYNDPVSGKLIVDEDQQFIADYIGKTRESVNKQLLQLKNRGAIKRKEYSRRIEIADEEMLAFIYDLGR